MYKEIRVLIQQYNQAHQNVNIRLNIVIFLMVGELIPFTFLAIKVKKSKQIFSFLSVHLILFYIYAGSQGVYDDTPWLLIFPLIILDTIIVTLVFGTVAGKINRNSLSMKAEIVKQMDLCGQKRKLLIMMTKSMEPLKIRFGSNFMEVVTPLVMINFATCQSASLLFMSK